MSLPRIFLSLALIALLPGCAAMSELSTVFQSTLTKQKGEAERGDPEAQLILGKRYATGDGVPLDPVMAVQWHRK